MRLVHLFVCVVFFMALNNLNARAQVKEFVRKEYRKISSQYAWNKKYSYSIKISSTSQDPQSTKEDVFQYSFSNAHGRCTIRQDDFDRIIEKNYSVLIDHISKTVTVSETKSSIYANQTDYTFWQEKAFENALEVDTQSNEPELRGVVFTFNNTLYKTIEVKYNSTTYMLSEVLLTYPNGKSTRIVYTIDLNPQLNIPLSSVLIMPKKIRKKNSIISLAPQYNSYRLINLIN